MAKILIRNNLFKNQLRKLHNSPVVNNVPVYNSLKEKEEFNNVLPEVMNTLLTKSKFHELPEVAAWVKQILEYTLPGGTQSRGLTVPMAYQMLEAPENFKNGHFHSARILGWCHEMLQSTFLLLDDIIDGSKTRRGKTCWYRQKNIGLNAINDSLLMQQCIMEILKIYFGKTPFYLDAVNIFNHTILYTSMGEYFDTSSTYNKFKNNIHMFTVERYNTMAMYKSAYNSFRLPILLAALLTKERHIDEKCIDICRDLGKYLQMKNDYNDVYGEEKVTGKVGTDIEEGKCTWLSVTALQRCNDAQRSIFKEYYGSQDPDDIKHIKRLYDELFMPQVYEQYNITIYKEIMRRIHTLSTNGEKQLFLNLLDACYKMAF